MKGMQSKNWLSDEMKKQWQQETGRQRKASKDGGMDPHTPLKFWEINDFFKCPVVGMCLTLHEQKQLLKKSRSPGKEYQSVRDSRDPGGKFGK